LFVRHLAFLLAGRNQHRYKQWQRPHSLHQQGLGLTQPKEVGIIMLALIQLKVVLAHHFMTDLHATEEGLK
jgi:hypothetical protein